MNKRFVILSSLIVSLVAFTLNLVFSSISSNMTVNALSDQIREIHARNLETLVSPMRNDLVSGNIREVRNHLYQLKDKGVFSAYQISSSGKIVDETPGFELNAREPGMINVPVSISFSSSGEAWGQVSFLIPNSVIRNLSSKTFSRLLVTSTILSLGIFLLVLMLFYIFFAFGHRLIVIIDALLIGRPYEISRPVELIWKPILELFIEIKMRLDRLEAERSQLVRDAALAQIATQVAHDIRSPLTAMKFLTSKLGSLDDEHRRLFDNSIERINEIANDLLRQAKSSNRGTPTDAGLEPNSVISKMTAVNTLLRQMVKEKQASVDPEIGIEFRLDLRAADSASSPLADSDLLRILSNLINNALEAVPSKGIITLSSRTASEQIEISVSDNGKGIPEAALTKIGERGFSYGKTQQASGSGLGVFHAKTSVEAVNGRLIIQSKEGEGTWVRLTMPLVRSPIGNP